MKKYKPTTPGRRFASVSSFDDITGKGPLKSLTKPLKSNAGRNSQGRVVVRHRGGGHKKKYRCIDFRRDKFGVMARVVSIEYDPNRSARIALLQYTDGEKRYIIAPYGLSVNNMIVSGPDAEAKVGNCLPMDKIPDGFTIHNIEMHRGRGGQLVRGAGEGAQLMTKESGFAQLKLPSGEIRLVSAECFAVVGSVGNPEHFMESAGKAGRSRWRGRRPSVRGVAMNPIDHPHGGGEGKASGGRHPVTPWGVPTKGYKTRKKKKALNKLIVKRRVRKTRKK